MSRTDLPVWKSWICPICGEAALVRTVLGLGTARSNHLRRHHIWTSFMGKSEKIDADLLKLVYELMLPPNEMSFKEALNLVRLSNIKEPFLREWKELKQSG